MAPLNLATGPSSISVKVHPAVLLNICDAFIRRNSKQHRVVGTLLGYIADNVVEVKSCYAVPHNDTPESVRRRDALRIGLGVACRLLSALMLLWVRESMLSINAG